MRNSGKTENLRPFSPGVSGNPAGRPKIIADIREAARGQSETALATLVDIAARGRNESARVAAAMALLARGWGLPSAELKIDASVTTVSPVVIFQIPDNGRGGPDVP